MDDASSWCPTCLCGVPALLTLFVLLVGASPSQPWALRAANALILVADHLLMPLHYVVDRLLIWPAVICVWFQPKERWPMPWSVSYVQLLDALVKFFVERYPPTDGKHPFSLSEDDFAKMMEEKQATHTMIPFELHWLGSFIRLYPPVTKPIVSLVLMPLLRWFVGPMGLHVDEQGDIGIHIFKCRFLVEARKEYGEQKGNELCVKQCAVAMEQIWRERVGVETWLDPDFETCACNIHAVPRPDDTRPYLDCASLDW